ncbi:hypothetical protein SAMN05444370_1191 [Rubrimonas cliftonensis]|uniref:AMP-binding enzyme C-terminal domain-containing protein n=1 Tax=Rubrimonas cliftonensis TaxID=89524 RepID=A0A1H4F7T9_9RHOB|nr:hypothetical protein SAMN05444370_1191 [Rubrimonas cliftonensis]
MNPSSRHLSATEPLDGADCAAAAPHLPEPTPLNDRLTLLPNGAVLLEGRKDEQVSIAGKRTSLGAVNAILATTPFACDAVAIRGPSDLEPLLILVATDGETSLCATDIEHAVRRHLLAHLDAVLVPRRVFIVPRIDRTETGKVTAATLAALRDQVFAELLKSCDQ